MIRRKFLADMTRRFRKLKAALQEFLVEKDELGLKPYTTLVKMERTYQFQTDSSKLASFNTWFKQQIEADINSSPDGTAAGTPWTQPYIDSSYKRGLINAYLASKSSGLQIDEALAKFLLDSFNAPEAVSKVRLLGTRSFEQLKGITAQMGADMNRILAQGMIDGLGVVEIAKEMSDRIDTLTNTRALVIARTEIINAHAEGQLDSFEALGVEELGVKAEWSTAGDDRVCPECEGMEGEVFTIEEAHGLIPLHPNCRCTWIPFVSVGTAKAA